MAGMPRTSAGGRERGWLLKPLHSAVVAAVHEGSLGGVPVSQAHGTGHQAQLFAEPGLEVRTGPTGDPSGLVSPEPSS